MDIFVSEIRKYGRKTHMADIPQLIMFLSQKNLDHVGWVDIDTDTNTDNSGFACAPIDIDIIRPSNTMFVPYNHLKVMSFDIEVKSVDSGMPKPHRLSDTVEMISVVMFTNCKDNRNTNTNTNTFLIHAYEHPLNIENCVEIACKDEDSVIIEFFKLIEQEDPTILTGFNIYSFDLHYLVSRLQLRLTEIPDVSRGLPGNVDLIRVDWTSDAYGHNNYNRLVIGGRLIIDMYLYFKRMKLDKYSLDFISNKFINERKHDMPHKQMVKAFSSNNIDALRTVAKYCIQDSMLVMKLFEKVQMWIDACEIAKITRCNIEDIYTRGEQMKLVSQCVKECMTRRIVLQSHYTSEWKQYEGAYVLEPKKGIYEGCSVVDFQSLYPSIIIAYNICPSTYVKSSSYSLKISQNPTNSEGVCDFVYHEICVDNIVYHYFRKEPIGLLPGMIKSILDERKYVKERMKTMDKTSVDYIVFDRRQNALKICANSVYGMMGFKNSRYFGHVECAESVTTVGRQLLSSIVTNIENNYPVKVIYGDTDSCMLWHDSSDKKKILTIGKQICDDVTAALPKPMALKFESYCEKILLLTKKRYVLVSDGKVSYKGVMNARRDYCKYAKDTYSGVIQLVATGNNEQILDYIDTKIVQLLSGACDIVDLIVTKSIGRKLSTYKVNQPHVVLARRLSEKAGVDIAPGTRLEYVFTKEGKMSTTSELEEDQLEIDCMFYIKKQLATQIDDVLSAIGMENYIKNTWC